MGELARSRDAALHLARAAVDPVIERFLADDDPHRVLLLHGPAGTGKTALTRAAQRLAADRPHRVVDGRDLTPDPAALDAALAGLAPRSLVVIDTYEQLASLGPHLRDRVLPGLDGDVRVVVAGRHAPDPAWTTGPLAAVVTVLAVPPFTDQEADRVLRLRGVDAAPVREAIVAWADGLPLALDLAATSAAIRGGSLEPTELDRALLDHLTEAELAGADRDVLAVAAIAPAVDARLLAAALPGVDGPAAEAWVRGLSFSEPLGRAVTLHDRVRRLLQAELKAHEPEYDRTLRLRIVDHLAERAVTTEPHLLADMQDLVDTGIGTFVREALSRFSVDRVREADFDAVATHLGPDDPAVDRFHRWMRHAPEHIIVVRDGERLAALALWATPRLLPTLPGGDAVLDRWTAYAAEHVPDDRVVFLPDVVLPADPDDWLALLAIGNVAMLVRAGVTALRAAYIGHDDRAAHEAVAGGPAGQVAAFGGVPEPGLDVPDGIGGEIAVRGYVIDYGPTGVVGATREFVHRMLESARPVDGAAPPSRRPDPESVRRALRAFHRPLSLVDTPWAVGATPTERVASVRRTLLDAVEATFGDSADERLLRATVVRGYLDEVGGPAVAMRELHLSRTTYYRRLAEATERVAATLVAAT